jgi:hypothetical protein
VREFEDRADQMPQVVTVVRKVLGHGVEQHRVRGRIGYAEIIYFLHRASIQIVLPDAVDDGPGEERIPGRRHPASQEPADVFLRIVFFNRTVEILGKRNLFGLRVQDLALFHVIGGVLVFLVDFFDSDPRKKGREPVEIVLGPLFPGVIVVPRGLLSS